MRSIFTRSLRLSVCLTARFCHRFLYLNFIQINPDRSCTLRSRGGRYGMRSMRKRRRKRGKGGADRTGINEWPENRKGSIQALSCTCNDDVPRATGNFGNYVVPAILTGPVTRNCNLTPAVATCQFQLRVLFFLSILVHFLPPFIRLHLPCPFPRIRWSLTTTTSKLSTRYRLTTTSTWVCCDAKRCFKIFQLFEKCFAHEKKNLWIEFRSNIMWARESNYYNS